MARGLGGNDRFPGTRDSFHRPVECGEQEFARRWEMAFGKKADTDKKDQPDDNNKQG